MDNGFPYGDLIVMAAIAAFIVLRYRAMLGETRGRDPGAAPQVNPLERVVQLPSARISASDKKLAEEKPFASYGLLAETFAAIQAIDKEFSPEDFMVGANAAYGMVLAAFSKRDRETLKMLLSESLYRQFDQAIHDEEAAKLHTDTTLVAIIRATIAEAKCEGDQATLWVDFVSDQVHLVRDAQGSILEGDASVQNRVEDRWCFTRHLRSSSPNWVILET